VKLAFYREYHVEVLLGLHEVAEVRSHHLFGGRVVLVLSANGGLSVVRLVVRLLVIFCVPYEVRLRVWNVAGTRQTQISLCWPNVDTNLVWLHACTFL
jgi:hypothetical protein